MLTALSIRDFAIIDALDLELGAGLTVITGETGAGKSVLINALNLVLGDRARAQLVRTGAERASVEALFDLNYAPVVRARLAEAGIEGEDELVVRRVIGRKGRSRVYLNGTLASLSMLARITDGLVDISGQHEHYSLLKVDRHLDILDRIAGIDAPRAAVAEAYAAVTAIDARMAELADRQRLRVEREGFLRFQLDELAAAELSDPLEEDTLEAEARRLANMERLRGAAQSAERLLYSADGAVVERLQVAREAVATLASVDAELAPMLAELDGALAVVEDVARTVDSYGRGLYAEPERLDQVETRLAQLAGLRRKFGATLPAVIERQAELTEELRTLETAEAALESLTAERAIAGATLLAAADTLTAARQAAATDFAGQVCTELADLGMTGATLVVGVDALRSGMEVEGRFVGPRGADRVAFFFSANPGEAPGPLASIASGGELSRFMLAVKRVIAERDPVAVYVFDEVDTGVGGSTAEAIGRKLQAVAATRQALCITHLPQIAALGDHHLLVRKETVEGRTHSQVHTLSRPQRVEELARMLGGAVITKTTRANARELLRLGRRTLV
jgi:DNA repair protein RecN (Recombination protein N)